MLKSIAIILIDFYKIFISPLLPASCRFHPSCSSYSRQAIVDHGFLRGFILTSCRICECHPFHPGGYDPVPPLDNQV